MSRSAIVLLLFLIALAIALYFLSSMDTEVGTQTIETPVADDALQT